MEDKQIVDLYWKRSETAIEESKKKYGKYCRYIANQILSCSEDAEEIENDTYMKAWNSIPPHRPSSLKVYLGMLCRRTAINRLDEYNSQKRRESQYTLALDELEECISSGESADNLTNRVALQDALNRFLGKLPKITRDIFIQRYWYMCSVSKIAYIQGMSESNVKMHLLRTRNKLKLFLEKEGLFE